MNITIIDNSENFLIIDINGVEYCYSYKTLIAKRIDDKIYATKKVLSRTNSKHLGKYLNDFGSLCEVVYQDIVTA